MAVLDITHGLRFSEEGRGVGGNNSQDKVSGVGWG